MKRLLLIIIVALAQPLLRANDDLVVADFESTDYGEWKVTGEAFGPGPARGTLPGQMPVDGFNGHGLVNSLYHGDGTTGTLTSPPFQIVRKYIGFLIGGGKDLDRTAMHLLIDGKLVRRATGPNDRAGGSETLIPDSWDLSDLLGQTAVIQIVDNATGGWGHINVDQIVQTDRKPPGLLAKAKREFKIEKRYLNLPIKNGPTRKVTLRAQGPAGSMEVQNDIGLADAEPDWWSFIDVSPWRGDTLTIEVDKLREDSAALSSIEQSDEILHADNLYREPARGQFHFSARRGWNNDPNGLAFYRGEYHLFFQHNPYGWSWGNMHWGHAVSRDLVHWRELGDALAPDKFGPMFSGSAVVDWKNTSGLGRDGQPPLVLFYTAAGDPTVQCIASSLDGRHFTKFEHNPVVPQITPGNRDPKVIWYEPRKSWIMTLYVETNKTHTIHFLGSTNLKDWKLLSQTDGFFECPDFFELPVDGNPANKKWVLTAGSSEYRVGTFDGEKFTPETPKLPGHRGKAFYAAQTYSDLPAVDGRRIQIGWFQTETKGMPFNQSMTLPMELKLIGTPDGPRLTWTPVKELETLRASTANLGDLLLEPGQPNPLSAFQNQLLELDLEIEPLDGSEVTLTIRGGNITYDARRQELVVNGHHAPAPLRNGRLPLAIYCDRASLELFASDGLTYIPMPFIPKADDLSLGIETKTAAAHLRNIRVYQLRPSWSSQEL
jgi:fructan beta-fructosidase